MKALRALRIFVFAALAYCALFAFGSTARAADPVGNAPRDVPIVLEPHTVVIPPLMAEMVSESHGWLTISYPASVKDRVAPLVASADAFKAELEDRLGQDVLDQVEVRIARSPEDMTALAPQAIRRRSYAVGRRVSRRCTSCSSRSAARRRRRRPISARCSVTSSCTSRSRTRSPATTSRSGSTRASRSSRRTRRRSSARAHALGRDALGRRAPAADLDKSFPDENYEVSIAYAESADFVRFLSAIRGSRPLRPSSSACARARRSIAR